MKRLIVLFAVVSTAVFVSGCGSSEEAPTDASATTPVTTGDAKATAPATTSPTPAVAPPVQHD